MAVFGAGFVGTMYQLVQYGNVRPRPPTHRPCAIAYEGRGGGLPRVDEIARAHTLPIRAGNRQEIGRIVAPNGRTDESDGLGAGHTPYICRESSENGRKVPYGMTLFSGLRMRCGSGVERG